MQLGNFQEKITRSIQYISRTYTFGFTSGPIAKITLPLIIEIDFETSNGNLNKWSVKTLEEIEKELMQLEITESELINSLHTIDKDLEQDGFYLDVDSNG